MARDKAAMLFSALAAVSLLVAATTAAAQEAPRGEQLSLQLRRGQGEVPPPDEAAVDDSFGRFDRSVGGFGIIGGYFDQPVDVAVDAEENLWVLDRGNRRVQVFDRRGDFLRKWGEKGTREGEFDSPEAIALDSRGFVYVVDTGNHRIQKLDGAGKAILSWGSLGSRTGLFNRPRDIAFDAEDNVYVADPGNDRIQKFNANGKFIDEWTRFTLRAGEDVSFGSIVSLSYDDDRFGYILALSADTRTVYRFETDGDYGGSWPVQPAGECRPARMEVDNDRDFVFLVDSAGNRVLRYTKDGALQGELGTAGDASLSSPGGLFVDRRNRRLYVADTGNNLIQKYYLR